MRFYLFLASVTPLFPEWKVTALFYSTLHGVQEYAVQQGGEIPTTHRRRKKFVLCHLPEVYDAYVALQNLSISARYDTGVKMTDKDVAAAVELRLYVLAAVF